MVDDVAELNRRLARADKLFRLAAEDVIFFSTYCEKEDRWKDSPYYTPCVNVNDTFAYACADAEELPDEHIDLLIECHNRWGHDGVTAWAAYRRGGDPIPPRCTDKYREARAFLERPDGLREG